jgi:two-component system sensor histidine kinase ChvG
MRRFLSPIAARLLLFNVLLVFLPIAGLFSLRAFERELLVLQERSMVQQARVAAAALAGESTVTAEHAQALVRRLGGRSESRIRVIDRSGVVVADSAAKTPGPIEGSDSTSTRRQSAESRTRVLYRVGAALYRAWETVTGLFEGPTRSDYGPSSLSARQVAQRALGGRYAATVTVSSGQRSMNLYVALPVRANGSGPVTGAVMVSQSTSRILRALWRVRLDTFEVFALSVAAAVLVSLLVSATIARPLIRLRNEADELLDHRGRLRRRFQGSRRRDEIGDLTRALEQLTTRLERHLAFVESFSADVSHEFKNPLASIRNAAELLSQTEDSSEREELATTIEKEVARLTRLLGAVREVSKVDAAVDMEASAPIDLRVVCTAVSDERVRVRVELPSHPLFVNASAERLEQALANVVDNALSFSSLEAAVTVTLREERGLAVLTVDDEGPGIFPEHLDRIFERFFSFRPEARGDHDGLGLAISRAILEAYGGTITAANRTPRGTRIEMRMPVVGSR